VVHDDGAAAPLERTVGRAIDRVAHLIEFDRAGVAGRDDEDVGMHAAFDPGAGGAGAARVPLDRAVSSSGGDGMLAVERLRERNGGQALADALRSGEEQAWRQRRASHRAREQVANRPTPRDRAEGHDTANLSRAPTRFLWILRALRILRILRLLRILVVFPEQLAPEAAFLLRLLLFSVVDGAAGRRRHRRHAAGCPLRALRALRRRFRRMGHAGQRRRRRAGEHAYGVAAVDGTDRWRLRPPARVA